jgi:hypothetical protein
MTGPSIVVLPNTSGLSVRYYSSTGDYGGSFQSYRGDFGVAFGWMPGSIRVQALTTDQTVSYCVVPWSWRCSVVYVTTGDSAVFGGLGPYVANISSPNISIGPDQNVCFYHISDESMTANVDLSVTQGNRLYIRSESWVSYGVYTGTNMFTVYRNQFVGFKWAATRQGDNDHFLITVTSSGSSLPTHRSSAVLDPSVPQLLSDSSYIATSTPNPSSDIRLSAATPINFSQSVIKGTTLKLTAPSSPLIVTILQPEDFELSVYSGSGDLVGKFEGGQRNFAVIFHSEGGMLAIRALSTATFAFYAVPFAGWGCNSIWFSTSPSEKFIGSGPESIYAPSRDFSILEDLSVCMFHVATGMVNVLVDFSIEPSDEIFLEAKGYDWTGRLPYSGIDGAVFLRRGMFTGFRWPGWSYSYSDGFQISIEAQNSSFQPWKFSVANTDGDPTIMTVAADVGGSSGATCLVLHWWALAPLAIGVVLSALV